MRVAGVAVGILAAVVGIVALESVKSLIATEVSTRLQRVPFLILRVARWRLSPEHREAICDEEWYPELWAIIHETDGLPLTQLVLSARWALGVAISARKVSRIAGPSRARLVRHGRRRRSLARRLIGSITAGMAAGMLLLSALVFESSNAVAGDTLYGVKRASERAQLVLAKTDLERGLFDLEYAQNRIDETRAANAIAVRDNLLDDADYDTREGARLLTGIAVDRRDGSSLDAIDTFVADQRRTLGRVRDEVPQTVGDRIDISLNLLYQPHLRRGRKAADRVASW